MAFTGVIIEERKVILAVKRFQMPPRYERGEVAKDDVISTKLNKDKRLKIEQT